MLNDLNQSKMVDSFNVLKGKYSSYFGSQYVPMFTGDPGNFLTEHTDHSLMSEHCPTAIGASENGN